MPEATGLSYGEGESFELDEREAGNKRYIAELGDVVAKEGSPEHKSWQVMNAQKEAALEEEALKAKGLDKEKEKPKKESKKEEGV